MGGAIEFMSAGSSNVLPDASKDWLLWCRLCAKADIQNVNIFLKDEDVVTDGGANKGLVLTIAISNFFNVEINADEQLPIQLCTSCVSLINSLMKFNERVMQVQQMYDDLQNEHRKAVVDLAALRLKYGVLENEQPHQFMYISLAGVQLFAEKHEQQENSFAEANMEMELQEEHYNGIEIKRENSNDVAAALNDENVCDFEDEEDAEGEDPFGSDFETSNEEVDAVRSGNAKNDSRQMKTKNEIKHDTTISASSASMEQIKAINKNKTQTLSYTKAENNLTQHTTNNDLAAAATKEGVECDDKKGAKPYTCADCAKRFKRLSNYRLHMERKHDKTDAVPRFACTHCYASFNTQTQLNHHHTIKHLPLAERRILPCPHCEQKFPTKQYVTTHIKYVHMNERSFICEECGEAVRSNGQLKQHMLTHTDYAPFECEVCKKCFKNQERLKIHMETHNPNKHICAECGLQLNSRITLNRHLLVHSDVMQHKCDFCGRAFKRAKALKNHLILHTGLKPYSCDFCDKTFANGSNCRNHKRKSHPVELAAQEAAGEKSYTKNIPKLAVLKSVTQAAENLAPVVSKQSGNFAFGKKPNLPLDSVGTISKKQRKIYTDHVLASTSKTSVEPIENSKNNQSSQSLLHPKDLQLNSKNDNDNINVDNQNIPTIDNIYSHLMKQTSNYRMDVKTSRSVLTSPVVHNSCIDIDMANAIAQQQQQLSQQVIASSPQQQQTNALSSEAQSFYRC